MTMNYTATGLQHAAEHLAGQTAAPTIASRIRAAGRLAESLERLAKTRNPTVTPDAHALKVEAKAKAAAVDLQRVQEGFTAAIQTRLADLESNINELTNFRANDQASEIRAAIRAMPENERRDAVLNMTADTRNGPVLAALHAQPEFLTGLQPEFVGKVVGAYQSKLAPAEVAERDALLDEQIGDAHSLFGKVEHYVKHLPTDTAAIKEGIEKAMEADEAYSTASALAN